MNRYVVSTIFGLMVFSLCCMEENSGGSAGKNQSIFSIDTLLETKRAKINKSSRIESWRQVTPEDLERIAQRLGVPDKAVSDASLYYKKMTRSFDTFRDASRERILSQAEMYRRVKMSAVKAGKAKRDAWDVITEEDKKRKAEEVGVSLETAHKALQHYRTNKMKPETFWQADRRALEEAAGHYDRRIQRKRQMERDGRIAHALLELQTRGEQP